MTNSNRWSSKGRVAVILALLMAITSSSASFGAVAPLPGPGNPLLFDDFGGGGAWGSKGLDWVNWYNQDGGAGTEAKAVVDGRTVGRFGQTPASSASWAKFQPMDYAVNLSGYRYLNFTMKNPGYPDSRIKINIWDGTNNYTLTAGWIEVPTTWTESSFDLDALTPMINKKSVKISVWLTQTGGLYGETLIDEISATTDPYSGTSPTLTATSINQNAGFENTRFTFDAVYTDVDNQRPTAMEIVVDDSVVYRMSEVDGNDLTYVDGKRYTHSTKLAVGTHTYYFRTADGTSDPVATQSQSVTVNSLLEEVDVNDNTIGEGLGAFTYIGSGWAYSAAGAGSHELDQHHSATAGNETIFTFVGTQARLYGATDPAGGMAAVSVDNGPELTIDVYSATRLENVLLYTTPTLSEGIHTVKIRVTGTRVAESAGTTVFVDRINATTYMAGLIDSINVNQAGYSARSYKSATVTSIDVLTDKTFEVLDGETVVARGVMIDEGVTWNRRVYTIDFSAVTQVGSSFTIRSNGVSSYAFAIQPNIWESYTDEMTAFYRLLRMEDTRAAYPPGYSSIAPSEKIFHPAAFQDDGVVGGTHYDLTGGWQDAGDYGKYAGNMWVVGNMAISYVRHSGSPAVNFDNDHNGVPDLIDEAQYGSDYLMKFATQLNGALYDFSGHSAFKHPEKITDNVVGTADDRVAKQLAVNGSAKGAASLAATARAINTALADGSISAANTAAMQARATDYQNGALTLYNYAFNNQSGNQGSYSSGIGNALLFAEVEIALLTNDAVYTTRAAERIAGFPALKSTNYWDMGPLAFAEFLPLADQTTRAVIEKSLKQQLDFFVSSADDTPYGVLNQFSGFGVNEPHASFVADAIRYYEIFGDPTALRAAMKGMFWLTGSNPWNFSWVSGVGTDFVKYLHTRLDEEAYDPVAAGLVLPGALVSGPNLTDPKNPTSASPWYQDRGLFQDNTSSWRYNEYSVSIQAGLFYSIIALADMNPENPAPMVLPDEFVIESPNTGDYVRDSFTLFAQPVSGLSSAEYNSGSGYLPMSGADGTYSASVDVSTMAANTSRRVDVRGTQSSGSLTYSSTFYTVAPPLADPDHPFLYDDFGGNGDWGGQGLDWVNWWNQDGGTATYNRTTVDGRTVGRFSQTPASSKSQAKFQPWDDSADISGYRYVNVTMMNPGFPDLRIKINVSDGTNSYSLTQGFVPVSTAWAESSFDLDALAPALNKKAVKFVVWLSQVNGLPGEVLIDDIRAVNVASGSAPTLSSFGVTPSSGDSAADFTFAATYTDSENQKPLAMEVLIDGVIHTMSPVDVSDVTYSDGKIYSFTTRLFPAHHTFSFHTTDTTTAAVSSAIGTVQVSRAPTIPAPPLDLKAISGDARAALSWAAAQGAETYNVGRSTTPGGPFAVVAAGVPSTTYTDQGLTNGVSYYYVVTATNGDGTSANSEQAISVPVRLGANVAQNSATLTDSVYSTYDGSKAVDGVVSDASRWLSTDSPGPHWIEIHLGASYTIGASSIYTGYGTGSAVSGFVLQSWDGYTWRDIPGTAVSGNTSVSLPQTFTSPVTTDRVRFLSTDNGYVRVKEVKLLTSF